MAGVTNCSDLEAKEIKSVTFSIVSPYIDYEVMGPDAMILGFLMLSFTPAFTKYFKPHSSFTFIKRFFSSSSLSAIRVMSSVYLRLLVFLQAILVAVCGSSSLAFHMMYTACKLNKQGNYRHHWCFPFPIWNQSIVLCLSGKIHIKLFII